MKYGDIIVIRIPVWESLTNVGGICSFGSWADDWWFVPVEVKRYKPGYDEEADPTKAYKVRLSPVGKKYREIGVERAWYACDIFNTIDNKFTYIEIGEHSNENIITAEQCATRLNQNYFALLSVADTVVNGKSDKMLKVSDNEYIIPFTEGKTTKYMCKIIPDKAETELSTTVMVMSELEVVVHVIIATELEGKNTKPFKIVRQHPTVFDKVKSFFAKIKKKF